MTDPRTVFDRLSRGISAGNWAELSALYTEDTIVEHPQRPPLPTRIDGREAVHRHFTGALAESTRLRAHDVVVHSTTDPAVIVAEYQYDGEAVATGKTFHTANIQVLRIRDGLIATSRDYHDYLIMTAAFGGLGPLLEALENTEPVAPPPIPARAPSGAAPGSPRAVFESLVYGVSDGRWAELPDLYAEQTHVTHPFLPGSKPLETRDALREHFTAATGSGIQLEARDLVVHEGTDPEVVIGEFGYQSRSATGEPFRLNNIFVLRVRDGLVVESRDYGDHLAFAAATGRLPELTARLEVPACAQFSLGRFSAATFSAAESSSGRSNSPSLTPSTKASHSDGVNTRMTPSGLDDWRIAT